MGLQKYWPEKRGVSLPVEYFSNLLLLNPIILLCENGEFEGRESLLQLRALLWLNFLSSQSDFLIVLLLCLLIHTFGFDGGCVTPLSL